MSAPNLETIIAIAKHAGTDDEIVVEAPDAMVRRRRAKARVDNVVPLGDLERDFGAKITAAWQKTVEAIFEVGQLLCEAKAALPHGEFEAMVEKSCPFNIRTAQRLMQIASNEVLSEATHGSHLPASWRTLHELARWEPKELRHALSNHWIKPELERREVEPLHRRVRKALGMRVRAPKPKARSVPSGLERLRAAWQKATYRERMIFRAEIEGAIKADAVELERMLGPLDKIVRDAS